MAISASAEAVTNEINENLSETIIRLTKTCGAQALNEANIDVRRVQGSVYIGGSTTQTATTTINCNQTTDIKAAMRSELANIAKTSAHNTKNNVLTGDWGLFSETKAVSNTYNKNIMRFSLDDYMSCTADAINRANILVEDVVGDPTQDFAVKIDRIVTQEAKAQITACVQNTTSDIDLAVKMTNDAETTAKSMGTLEAIIDGIGRIISSLTSLVVAAGVVGALGFIAYVVVQATLPDRNQSFNERQQKMQETALKLAAAEKAVTNMPAAPAAPALPAAPAAPALPAAPAAPALPAAPVKLAAPAVPVKPSPVKLAAPVKPSPAIPAKLKK